MSVDNLGSINPGGLIEFKLHESMVAESISQQYQLRKMEYVFPKGLYCPLLKHPAHILYWRLNGNLEMIPTSFEIE